MSEFVIHDYSQNCPLDIHTHTMDDIGNPVENA